MILDLWQFSKGYVRLRVTGFSVERFLNMAAYRGVYLWDVERTPEGVHVNVSIKGFKQLKGCSRKTKCRIKIIKRNGLPFIVHRYRKRKLLMGGLVFFVLMLYALSSFIWRIEVVGSEDGIPHEAVLVFLEQQGLHTGVFKHTVDAKEIQRELLNHFDEISWADIHTRGTRTTIMVAVAVPHQPIIDKNTPTHVVAAQEGLITAIATSAGAPLVRQNDVVKPGELLVSGIIELGAETGNPSYVYVQAHAEVWARRYHTIEFDVPLTYTQKDYTGKTKTRWSVQVLFANNRRFNFHRTGNPFDSYDRITTHRQPGASSNYPLPFVLISNRYEEFTSTTRTRTQEKATELANRILTNRILREFDFGIDIIDRQVEFFDTPDALQVRALITTHERIDKQVPLE